MQTTIGSSIICMDHLNFKAHGVLASEIGVDYLHVDVMDGAFVPRFGIYPEVARMLAEVTSAKIDLHLMVKNPDMALKQFSNISTIEYVSVHMESSSTNLLRTLDTIRMKGLKAVLVVDLASNLHHVAQYVTNNLVDGLMFMGIHPGILVQTHRPDLVVKNLQDLKLMCDIDNIFVQCDGGVNFESLLPLKKAGINNFVCGSSTLYHNCNYQDAFDRVEKKIRRNFQKIRKIINEEL